MARAPQSKSIGSNYAYRDYFHGGGADLPEGTTDVEPIGDLNLSAVYRSTSTGKLKVAFSVPISNGQLLESARGVSGVLAMSVDLGHFAVLDKQLSAEKEVMLIDLRPDTIEDVQKRGLILHHQELPNRSAGEPPPRLSAELLARIESALQDGDPVVVDYADPLERSDARFWGAVEPVVIKRRGTGEEIDTKWLVIVQEKLPEN